ncbi:sigma-54 interaction domain-containing protein [Shouchella lehensis]|uniref:Transcriptional regulator n=1 Tax=Shouchella lehensis G1 TaxID=1246626 RepID=A0A060M1N3_9BACI|nr:sigma 54-interacting transcriptional regulator [Shouchella lehensis]AIC94458.1 transcriptional regulator [Shouchella lehensis G1]
MDRQPLTTLLECSSDHEWAALLVVRNDISLIASNTVAEKLLVWNGFRENNHSSFEKEWIPLLCATIERLGKNINVQKETMFINGKEGILYSLNVTKNVTALNEDTQERKLLNMIEHTYDGLVMVDKDGYVQVFSKAYADFIEINQASSIGKHVTEVIPNTRMHIVAKSGVEETAQLQKVGNNYIIVTRTPIYRDKKLVGAVGKLLFKNIGQFTALFRRLNALEKEVRKYKGEFQDRNKASYSFQHLIGESKAFIEVIDEAKKAAKGQATILLLGESGTGKELFAHSIHQASPRSMGVFVKVNCAAIPNDLLEAELFGYEEGSFTGAKKGGKPGKFEMADGGTIFLDEIGELPLHMQVKLLRVLQEREVERVGGLATKSVDVRIIAATNQSLQTLVEKGKFRLDLYYRLNVIELKIPALRDRKADIEQLIHFLLAKYETILGITSKGIDSQTITLLKKYHFPGNIRELENIVERALTLMNPGDWLTPAYLSKELKREQEHDEDIQPLAIQLEKAEKEAIKHSLIKAKGNKSEAANQLGIGRTTLYEKLAKHQLS